MIKITGVKITINISIMPAIANEKESALIVAMVLGDTSPKIRITIVSTPVAIPEPISPKISIARIVAIEDAPMFTILLPIKIAESILPLSLVTFKTFAARLSPFSAKFFMRILFTVVSAVSDDEKNADKNTKTMILINWPLCPGPNSINNYLFL